MKLWMYAFRDSHKKDLNKGNSNKAGLEMQEWMPFSSSAAEMKRILWSHSPHPHQACPFLQDFIGLTLILAL